MPIKLTVAICRKVGQPNYGSASASCNAEVELPDHSLEDREAIQQHAKQAYAACEKAVTDQLADQADGNHHSAPDQQNGNGKGWRPASEKQMNFIRQLAARIEGLGVRKLETLSQKMFGTPVAALSSYDASRLIDVLKKAQAGEADLQAVLGEE